MSSTKSGTTQRQQLTDRLQFLGQMGSTETALFHQKMAERFGVGITDMKAISTIMQEGDMTAGQLARRLSLTTGAITNVLDKLEERGVIKRTADPADRRKVIVTVNSQAITAHSLPYESIGQAYQRQLSRYSFKELKFLVSYHEQQIELTKQAIAELVETGVR